MNNKPGVSQPPVDGVYKEGFKGKGMCAHCWYRTKEIPGRRGNWLCGFYGSACKQVSRNCTGIKILK